MHLHSLIYLMIALPAAAVAFCIGVYLEDR